MKNVVFWDVSRLALVRTGISEERSGSINEVARISELGPIRSIRRFVTLMMEAQCSSETSVFNKSHAA
jgi:hypothetical protein